MAASYDFVQLDVLPEGRSLAIHWPFSPTHVVLTDKQMQALAREMTTREELPFAGHPTRNPR
jgi:predicted PhzF superfamily epimerase YddE/YHI9